MRYFSTRDHQRQYPATLKEAVLRGLAADGGLYVPETMPSLDESLRRVDALSAMSQNDIALAIANLFCRSDIEAEALAGIVTRTVSFETPVVRLDDNLYVLELFHGPSLAFKDMGARFMAQLMSHFVAEQDRRLTVLVATSGDTGGAVAMGFAGVPNIDVVILYPSGRVSALQEKQLTSLGGNVQALEIDGSFDDCQAMVKAAFNDSELRQKCWLTSANSINIGRLIPQSFYYADAIRQLQRDDVVFVVPSGNFGNLCAGLWAQAMGVPIQGFVAATNSNRVVPSYLESGRYIPKESIATMSNAMDVGAPSNFERLRWLFGESEGQDDSAIWQQARLKMSGHWVDEDRTQQSVRSVYERYGYCIDPHGAVGIDAAESLAIAENGCAVVLETAHPSKFLPTMENILGADRVQVPERLAMLAERPKHSIQLNAETSALKEWLLNRS